LLVEDNELNREVALGLLEDAQISIESAENGEIAVQMVGKNDYDLVLMDMQMPVMDGITATKSIRANPRRKSLPVIAMTANAMDRDREACLKAGMNDHLAKPIDPEKLYATLLRWIPHRAAATTVGITSAAVGITSPAPRAESQPLVIPGIDTPTALKRTGGNRKRYESLLLRFAESQAGAARDIRDALADQDSRTAERLAHSLKGAAGNLGATSLAEAAARTEAEITSKQSTPVSLDELSHTLDATIGAIRAVLPLDEPSPTAADADPSIACQPLARLKKLLEADDGAASDLFVSARPLLSNVLTAAEMEALAGQVGNFAYAEALQTLSSIASRLSLNLE
jgi:CheY-like chemotaxis protein